MRDNHAATGVMAGGKDSWEEGQRRDVIVRVGGHSAGKEHRYSAGTPGWRW